MRNAKCSSNEISGINEINVRCNFEIRNSKFALLFSGINDNSENNGSSELNEPNEINVFRSPPLT